MNHKFRKKNQKGRYMVKGRGDCVKKVCNVNFSCLNCNLPLSIMTGPIYVCKNIYIYIYSTKLKVENNIRNKLVIKDFFLDMKFKYIFIYDWRSIYV